MQTITKIGFGGGCHWCTEAVFQSLKGVLNVAQGWIASHGDSSTFSEAVIVSFDPSLIPIEVLVEIHLRTHKSTSAHSMRDTYRSAIYVYNTSEMRTIEKLLVKLQLKFEKKLITQALHFSEFKLSREQITNYYYKNPQKPFCKQYISPKLQFLMSQFSTYTKAEIVSHLAVAKVVSKT